MRRARPSRIERAIIELADYADLCPNNRYTIKQHILEILGYSLPRLTKKK